MLIVYTGTNFNVSSDAANKMVSELQKKQPDAELIELNLDQSLEESLLSAANDRGLFFSKSLVKIPRLFPDKDTEEIMKNVLNSIAKSESVFIWVEPDLNKTWLKRLEKFGAKVVESGQKVNKKMLPGAFKVSDALLLRDKKKLWQAIKSAKKDNLDEENVFGVIWWQLRAIYSAKSSPDAATAGLSPYVYRKSVNNKWEKESVKKTMSKLLIAQKDSRSGGANIWHQLELWALDLN